MVGENRFPTNRKHCWKPWVVRTPTSPRQKRPSDRYRLNIDPTWKCRIHGLCYVGVFTGSIGGHKDNPNDINDNKVCTILTRVNYSLTPQCCAWTCSADSRRVPSQWERSLQSNAVSRWPGANLESALTCMLATNTTYASFTHSN